MAISGRCDGQFESLKEVFEENLASGAEVGAAIAVDVDGESVVDMWGGYRDGASHLPWEADTIINIWSNTKEICSLAVLMLVERGLVDVDAPVAEYWPEFGQSGKQDVLVRHVLSHTSGVSGWDQPFAIEDLYDWDTSVARLAGQAPWWEPGTASCYHAASFGHLTGEIVRRVTGKHLKDFVRDEIAGPLDVDLQIGALPEDFERIAPVIPPPPLDVEFDLTTLPADSPTLRTFLSSPSDANVANTEEWRRADIGATNGHSNARAVARTLSIVSRGGEVDGVRLLSPGTIDKIFEEQARGTDMFLGEPICFGIGFAMPTQEMFPYLPDERICYWGGWGGSITMMFLDRRMTVSYVMNKMGPGVVGSDRTHQYLREIIND